MTNYATKRAVLYEPSTEHRADTCVYCVRQLLHRARDVFCECHRHRRRCHCHCESLPSFEKVATSKLNLTSWIVCLCHLVEMAMAMASHTFKREWLFGNLTTMKAIAECWCHLQRGLTLSSRKWQRLSFHCVRKAHTGEKIELSRLEEKRIKCEWISIAQMQMQCHHHHHSHCTQIVKYFFALFLCIFIY